MAVRLTVRWLKDHPKEWVEWQPIEGSHFYKELEAWLRQTVTPLTDEERRVLTKAADRNCFRRAQFSDLEWKTLNEVRNRRNAQLGTYIDYHEPEKTGPLV